MPLTRSLSDVITCLARLAWSLTVSFFLSNNCRVSHDVCNKHLCTLEVSFVHTHTHTHTHIHSFIHSCNANSCVHDLRMLHLQVITSCVLRIHRVRIRTLTQHLQDMLSAHRALIGRASWAWRNSLHSVTICDDTAMALSGSRVGWVHSVPSVALAQRAHSAVMDLRSKTSRHLHTGIGLGSASSSTGGGSCCKHDAVKDKAPKKSECATVSTSWDTASGTGAAAAVSGAGRGINWRNLNNWKRAGVNTSWCLLGCSIGEFGTLAAFGAMGLDQVSA